MSEYLSSSNGKNVSFVPANTAVVNWSSAAFIVTSKVFLIFKVADDISTSDILFFGILVKSVLSSDFANGVVTSVRSGTSTDVLTDPKGKNPSATPATVVIPVTRTSFVFTSVILAKVFKFFPRPPNFNILPTFNLPGNWGFPLVIVLTPDPPVSVDDVTFADPNINSSCWTTSATKLFADPTFPKLGPAYNDLASPTPKDVTARATLLFSSPFIIIGSLGTNSPDFSYKVKDVVLLAFDLRNPVAPLNLPLIKAGMLCVIAWFKVISLNVCTSNNEISYSFMFELVALYDPDSKTKSYTLATPISFPMIDPPVGKPLCLWSLKLTTNVFPIPTSGDPVWLFSLSVPPVL